MARRIVVGVTLLSAAIALTMMVMVLAGSPASTAAGPVPTDPSFSVPTLAPITTAPEPTIASTIPTPVEPTTPDTVPTPSTEPPVTEETLPARPTTTPPAPAPTAPSAPGSTVPAASPSPGATTFTPRSHSAETEPPTTEAPTTTILGIGGRLPVSPSTLPLATKGSDAHVDTSLGYLSATGFGLALLIIAGRALVTRSGGRDRRPMH